MPSYTVPIMPKASKPPSAHHAHIAAPYPTATTSTPAVQRPATVWSSSDDEILLQARASGLNWQPIATRHFPKKSANACRKRHERLLEKRHIEDWPPEKLDRLSKVYKQYREEMWKIVAVKMGGEKWQHCEAKCMEKGLKSLLSTANAAERKARGDSSGSFDDQGSMDERHSDAGSAFGSDGEMDVEDDTRPSTKSSRHAHDNGQQTHHQEHIRSRSLPQPIARQLPLYQPPPPITTHHPRTFEAPVTTSPATMSFGRPSPFPRYAQDYHNGRGGISIQAMLSPAEPQFA